MRPYLEKEGWCVVEVDCAFKYESMGLSYPLEGVEPLSKERKENARAIFARHLPGIKIL